MTKTRWIFFRVRARVGCGSLGFKKSMWSVEKGFFFYKRGLRNVLGQSMTKHCKSSGHSTHALASRMHDHELWFWAVINESFFDQWDKIRWNKIRWDKVGSAQMKSIVAFEGAVAWRTQCDVKSAQWREVFAMGIWTVKCEWSVACDVLSLSVEF